MFLVENSDYIRCTSDVGICVCRGMMCPCKYVWAFIWRYAWSTSWYCGTLWSIYNDRRWHANAYLSHAPGASFMSLLAFFSRATCLTETVISYPNPVISTSNEQRPCCGKFWRTRMWSCRPIVFQGCIPDMYISTRCVASIMFVDPAPLMSHQTCKSVQLYGVGWTLSRRPSWEMVDLYRYQSIQQTSVLIFKHLVPTFVTKKKFNFLRRVLITFHVLHTALRRSAIDTASERRIGTVMMAGFGAVSKHGDW